METTQPVVASQAESFSLAPRNMDEALRFCETLAKSDIVPKDFKGNPGNIMVAVQWGMEIGLKPMQAMQNIAVINGRPSLWGDAVIALVRASPLCEYVNESTEGDTAICRVKRRGELEQVRTFSDADAKAAGLLGKTGPWTQYKSRMRQMRARAFALRDVFPDVLKGMPVAEEIMDNDPSSVVATQSATTTKQALPEYPAESFTSNFPKWKVLIENREKTPSEVIAKLETKYTVTKAQRDELAAVKLLDTSDTAAAESQEAAQ